MVIVGELVHEKQCCRKSLKGILQPSVIVTEEENEMKNKILITVVLVLTIGIAVLGQKMAEDRIALKECQTSYSLWMGAEGWAEGWASVVPTLEECHDAMRGVSKAHSRLFDENTDLREKLVTCDSDLAKADAAGRELVKAVLKQNAGAAFLGALLGAAAR